MKIKGLATPEGTARFAKRFEKKFAPGHFREAGGLWFSSLGIGSYLGEPDRETDAGYKETLKEAVRSGINVIDTAVNYRCQRSERSFGVAIRELIEAGEIQRDEIIVCTKGGFIPFDGEYPSDPGAYLQKTYVDTKILSSKDVVQGCHAMTPRYLEDQLTRSLENLGLESVDLYYVHNPETQLAEVEPKEFAKRLQSAFEFLEKKVAEGKIRRYGTATWPGFRNSAQVRDHLSLEEINILAREAGGADHHFKAVQLPVNLAMPEAWVLPNQNYGAQSVPFLEVARRLGLLVIASASLLQGQLARPLPPEFQNLFGGLEKSSQCSLQFVRSLPGITTALVGMKTRAHVKENLEAARMKPFSEAELVELFQKTT